jgi:hypothetical protein
MFWYDGNKTLTYNALFNFIIGNRGGGKTYWAKKWAIKDFLKNEKQFIYLRRYKQEIKKKNNDKFFNDIIANNEFENVKFEVKGNTFYINKKEAGQAMCLSTSKIEKSVPFPNVNKIIFDEFIIDKGVYRYLPDEVLCFLEFYETVNRMRNREVIAFFLANAISMTNPYFLYFNMHLPYGKNVFCKNDKLIELVQNEEYIAAKKATRFGKLIEGTTYADYSIDNKFLRDDKTFIEKKSGSCNFYFAFKYEGKLYGVWIDYSRGAMWVSEDIDPCSRIIYSITLDDHSPNTLLLRQLGKAVLFKTFIENYKLGNVRFESMKIKNVCYEVLKLSSL